MRSIPQTPTNRAVAYIRVSTCEQAREGVSLDAQEARIRAYCTMAGLELMTVIREEGVTASKALSTREGGRELEHLLSSGQVQHVAGVKLDRLFRDAADALQVTRAWDRAGVALHLVDMGGQTINTATAMGRMFLTLMAGFAELERNLISERTRAALQHLQSLGVRLGQKPLEGQVVTRAHELHAGGCTLREIAEVLTAEGFETKRGGRWQPGNIALLLKRPA